MKKIFIKLMYFWSEDRSFTTMFILLLLFIFVAAPILSPGTAGKILIKVIYSFMLVTAVLSVAKQKRNVVIVAVIATIGLFVNWLTFIQSSLPLLITHDFFAILFNLFFAVAILMKTFQPGDITFERIEGSIVVYLLSGLMFAFVFEVIYLCTDATSFNNISGKNFREFLYFSFTTLTTVGYGDITPVHPLARSLANFEALFGQLYPAILIARLVSMEFESSARKKEIK